MAELVNRRVGPIPYLSLLAFAATDFFFFIYTGPSGVAYALVIGFATVTLMLMNIPIAYRVMGWIILAYLFVYPPSEFLGAFLLNQDAPAPLSPAAINLAPGLLKTLQFQGRYGTRLLDFCGSSVLALVFHMFSVWAFGSGSPRSKAG